MTTPFPELPAEEKSKIVRQLFKVEPRVIWYCSCDGGKTKIGDDEFSSLRDVQLTADYLIRRVRHQFPDGITIHSAEIWEPLTTDFLLGLARERKLSWALSSNWINGFVCQILEDGRMITQEASTPEDALAMALIRFAGGVV